MESKKLVLFGAGKIGRSFIGQLFSRAGYEVVFIDIDKRVISELNQRREYRVVIKSEDGDEVLNIRNVRGVSGRDVAKAIDEVASADIVAVSVGQKAIPIVAKTVAQAIELRYSNRPDFPLDIILAENLRDAADVFKQEIAKYIDAEIDLDNYVGLIETSIGKMVPIMSQKDMESDPLLVFAEPYNTLILDKKGFKNPIPNVPGLSPKANMKAWVDRKSFIHNLGHAAVAYYGNFKHPQLTYLYEALEDRDVYEVARTTMLQSADILMKHYPGEFSLEDLTDHADDLLSRFANRALGDTIYRVGQDLYRKLGPEDRLVGALKLALKYRMPYDRILYIIACAMQFQAADELGNRSENDLAFHQESEKGISHVLEKVCGIHKSQHVEVYRKANELVKKLKIQ